MTWPATMVSSMDIDELLQLERRGWDSLCRGTGGEFYGRIMTPTAVMVLANGVVLDRDAVAASLDEAPPWREYSIEEPRLVELDERSAVLVYTGAASREDGEFRALMSSVYTRTGDQWQLALYQQTPLPTAR